MFDVIMEIFIITIFSDSRGCRKRVLINDRYMF
jgi:hypothetical protein